MRIEQLTPLSFAILLTVPACGDGAGPLVFCEVDVADELRACVGALNQASLGCYSAGDASCAASDPSVASALSTLEAAIRAQCADAEVIDEPDFTIQRSPDAWVARYGTACATEAAALSSRTFGGPHGAVWTAAETDARSCLTVAQEQAIEVIDETLTLANNCIEDAESCDVETFDQDVATIGSNAVAIVAASCEALEDLIALSPEQYLEAALRQVDCLVATAHADTTPLEPSCGPGNVTETPARGQYTQVVLDEETWGTRCGDGSSYAFQIRLAPEDGAPLDQVLIALEGGGVCLFEDCLDRPADLFEALTDEAEMTGIMSNDPEVSPFASWTKVYLPYCTQDVFIGGGVGQTVGEKGDETTIWRYGAVNTRASLRYVRDLLWRLLDAQDNEGYRPDRLSVMFGGFSAGAFGTIFNYHYLLDDLKWARTVGFPDAGLSIDNGELLGVVNLGNLLIKGDWLALQYLPPYCFEGECAAGPTLLQATSPRLKAVPEQQLLILSNQNDETQVNTTFFPDTPTWINAMRQSVCDTKDLNGVQYYLTSVTESVHVVSPREELYSDAVDGEIMRDWLANGFDDPDGVEDRIEEGDFVMDIAGVEPFSCEVTP